MNDKSPPRDKKVCFWCKYLDHSESSCHRRAPVALPPLKVEGESIETFDIVPSSDGAWWPVVDPIHDWCGEFEEGDASHTSHRTPQERDTDYV